MKTPKEEKKYHTRQKESVLRWFESHPKECLSAKDIIENPEIEVGEATVFRLLAKLTEEGTLNRYVGVGGALYQLARDASCRCHFHLKCLGCGKVVHLDCGMMNEVEKHIAEEHRFTVDVSRTVIYGRCQECMEGAFFPTIHPGEGGSV